MTSTSESRTISPSPASSRPLLRRLPLLLVLAALGVAIRAEARTTVVLRGNTMSVTGPITITGPGGNSVTSSPSASGGAPANRAPNLQALQKAVSAAEARKTLLDGNKASPAARRQAAKAVEDARKQLVDAAAQAGGHLVFPRLSLRLPGSGKLVMIQPTGPIHLAGPQLAGLGMGLPPILSDPGFAPPGAFGALPLTAPLAQYRVTSPFGLRTDPLTGESEFHTGIDLAAPMLTPVYATSSGTVVLAGYSSGYGNLIEIDNGNGIRTKFAHLSRILVAPGQKIASPVAIGLIGSTGHSTGPHLHYEILVKGVAQDPVRFLEAGKIGALVKATN